MKLMKPTILFAALLTVASWASADPANSPDTLPAPAAGKSQMVSQDKHIKPILDALNLNDTAKEAKVRDVLQGFFAAHTAWHQANDQALKGLWNDFNRARAKHNNDGADKAIEEIDGIYATFKSQHDAFIHGLATVLSPEQIETVEDVLTVNKVKVTYNVYLGIFPTLTGEQKTVVLKNLKDAREEAIDAGSMAEKSAFFKVYKIKIEDDYLTAQGYDPKQARKDFAGKQKASGTGQ
jgi:Spy/CpxP family protein refolding chaperone